MVDRRNRRYHDRVARRYDAVYDTPYWRFYREISWRHLRSYLPEARPATAADLGCGTGWFGRRLHKSGLAVVFLDPSGAMLEQCRRGMEAEPARGTEVRYVQGELENLIELADQSLDFATAQGDPLSFCADPLHALHEIRRCLRPGAHLVLSVDSRMAGVRSLIESARPDGVLELLRTGQTRWLAARHDESFPMRMFDPDELAGMLRKVGFEPLSTIAKTCLVQRANEHWLEDAGTRRMLLRAEESVHRLPQYLGLASHLQLAARRR